MTCWYHSGKLLSLEYSRPLPSASFFLPESAGALAAAGLGALAGLGAELPAGGGAPATAPLKSTQLVLFVESVGW